MCAALTLAMLWLRCVYSLASITAWGAPEDSRWTGQVAVRDKQDVDAQWCHDLDCVCSEAGRKGAWRRQAG